MKRQRWKFQTLCAVWVFVGAVGNSNNASANPPVMTNLAHWLDASDLDGDGVAEGAGESGMSGGFIDVWVDKAVGIIEGDAADNVTQAGTLRPVLAIAGGSFASGLPTVQFDGVDDYMQSAPFANLELEQPNTIIVLYKFDVPPTVNDRYVIDGLGSGRNAIFASLSFGGGNPTWANMWSGNFQMPDITAVVTQPIITGAVFDNTDSEIYTNGVLKNHGFGVGGQSMTGITVGSRFAPVSGANLTLDGEIAEVLVYGEKLTPAEVLSVSTYLNDKWLVAAPSISADFDGDNDVDGADFLIWQRNLGTTSGATREMGDADLDGAVDGDDLAEWKNGFGLPVATATAVAVPEPAASALLSLVVASAFVRRRRCITAT